MPAMKFLIVLLVAACAVGVYSERAEAAKGVQFGIQDDAWLEFGPPGTLKERVRRLDRLGFDVVRVTLKWHEMEQRRGRRFDWRRSDRLLGALNAQGLKPVVTLWGTPGWANDRSGPNVAPQDPGDFQRFVERVARRYPYVDRWVMWNEPNKVAWLKPVSPETYVTQILNPGYAGVKAVSPGALVAGGVTASRGGTGGLNPDGFIRRMRAAGALLDAYAHHPYPTYPGDTPYVGGCRRCKVLTMARLERLERLVGAAFPRARIWLTEYAYQTNPPDRFGVSFAQQARFIGLAARRVYTASKVDMLIHYLYMDEPVLARWQSGIVNKRLKPKPAVNATMLPFMQLSRKGQRIVVWGQVRPGDGPQRFVVQRRVRGEWVDIGVVARTDPRGFFRRTLRARKRTEIRLRYPTQKIASVPIVAR